MCPLRLCGSLRQAEASTLFRNLCVSPINVKAQSDSTIKQLRQIYQMPKSDLLVFQGDA
ncbi:MAG: hypothetical protein V7K15_01870 [Nostoc sp.]